MLVHNWREVLKRAWSVRLLAFLLFIIAAEPVYLFFAAEWVAKSFYVRLAMSALTGIIAAAALLARFFVQQKLSGDLNGKPPSEG
ncbi:conserved hypothetical protein [Rhizobium leguminosarum bv. trifolii WSM2304]|uniref:Transmembrane protein n=1 Tax=Rhizobium leguminosarum bv. trifolii (strain WSM2304) TaxID=395492 RepID=A0ABF7QP33_RHILW|nr:hypothetical protein [Rhizobium leguminosarum]ACI55679.1 conserved hypothetical protein [Rhizobium leguminosarum bv. trifolii WSM2304]